MSNSQENEQNQHAEISLIDLAIIFIRRRYIFCAVFFAIASLGAVYALTASAQYEYVSLIELAESRGGESLESPSSIIATLNNRWLPDVVAHYSSENTDKLPFEVVMSNPENTGLIRILSRAGESRADLVRKIHSSLIKDVSERQAHLLDMEKKRLQRQIDSLDGILKELEGQQGAGEAMAKTIEKRAELDGQLQGLRPMDVVVVSRQSNDRKGPGRAIIIMLSLVLGIMLGMFSVFMAEFVKRVELKMRNEENR